MTSSRSVVLYCLLEEYALFSASSGNSFKAKGKLGLTGLDFEMSEGEHGSTFESRQCASEEY